MLYTISSLLGDKICIDYSCIYIYQNKKIYRIALIATPAWAPGSKTG
jgi:hypothetical protein